MHTLYIILPVHNTRGSDVHSYFSVMSECYVLSLISSLPCGMVQSR